MNERFKELKRRAEIDGGDTSHIDYDKMWHDERRMLEDLAVEKVFAELIVRECAEYLSCAMEVHNQQEQDLMNLAARKIQEHFGVEPW